MLVDRVRGGSIDLEQIRGGKHLDQSCGEFVDIGLAFIEELDGGAAQDLAVVFAYRDAEMAIPAHDSLRQASEIPREYRSVENRHESPPRLPVNVIALHLIKIVAAPFDTKRPVSLVR